MLSPVPGASWNHLPNILLWDVVLLVDTPKAFTGNEISLMSRLCYGTV